MLLEQRAIYTSELLIDDIFHYIGQINKTLDYVIKQDEVNK